MDWKRKLERQSAAVLAIEAKNNSNKVARWTLSALLAGAELMKARFWGGYVHVWGCHYRAAAPELTGRCARSHWSLANRVPADATNPSGRLHDARVA